ncbi:MAG: 30S ribosomal protein S2, partial [Phycisphaerales bacterium]
KRQAREVLQQRVGDVGMHWVTERWLGGTLTNFRTIRSRLKRLEELEAIQEKDDFASYSKKMESQLRREMKKIKRNLDGIRGMTKLPGALVVIDVKRETNAIMEAKKLGIPTVCLIDTDGDPEMADIPIPGNDDSMRSIDVVIRELCAAITEGKTMRAQQAPAREGEGGENAGQPQRRSSRSQFRAAEDKAPAASEEKTEPAAPAETAN